jgi:DNA-binding LacI/PurR family transcriptional regulator
MITISDVAIKAGVSRATVSYVLNGRESAVRISESTRQRVMDTANELGYRRNELARAMITGRNPMLGFWVMQSNREPVVRILAGAMKEADANDYFIKMIGFDNGSLDERTLERCVEWRLAGIMAIHAPENTLRTLYPQIVQTGIPLVTVDSQRAPKGCLNITSNSGDGIRAVVNHLAELGHSRIAFLGGRNENEDAISGVRERAYTAAMRKLGLEKNIRVEFGDWCADFSGWEVGTTAAAARCLLNTANAKSKKTQRPTAIVCASDHMAMIVIRIATELGLRVPQDLSVTGFDDITVASLYNPPLTTVAQPFEEMGRDAVSRLLGSTDATAQTLLPARLIVRGSTAPPK